MNIAVKETEPLGITYDRLRLDKVLTHLVEKYEIKKALELPTDGAKAMPGIYSLALARAGCHVYLYNPEPQGLEVWRRLGLEDMFTVVEGNDPANTGLATGEYDLVWNFVTVGFRENFADIIAEMSRLTSRFTMTVHCNGYNYGYPWHRFLHWLFRLEWTHGETAYFFPKCVRSVYEESGLNPIDFGLLDMPWWPDPPGFRDVRLHLSGGDDVKSREWTAPIEEVYASGRVPDLLRFLSAIENSPVPKPVRYIFSHLFYVLGEKK